MAEQETALVRFYRRPKQDEAESAAAGRPIFHDTDYIQIRIPGDTTSEVDVPVTETHKQRFAAQFAAYKAGQDQDAASGTLLRAWGQLSESRCEELAYFKIRTVEALAGVHDGNLQAMGPGAREEREKARAFLEAAKSAAPITALQKASEEKDHRIAALEELVKNMNAEIEKLTAPKPARAPKVA